MEKKLTDRQNEIVDAALHLIAEKGMSNFLSDFGIRRNSPEFFLELDCSCSDFSHF